MNRRPGFPARLDRVVPARNATAVQPARQGLVSTQLQPTGPLGQANARSQSNTPAGLGLDSLAVRRRMVDGLRLQGLRDERVLAAMLAVERHRFVDSALVNQAYEDTSLPIGLGQTITKPGVVARMVELLLAPRTRPGAAPVLATAPDPMRLGRVLEIGSGCGYQAAVLAQVAREVYSIERLRGLHDKARDNLRPMKLHHVHLMLGDGMLGYAKGAPYDAIIAAAGGEALPDAWLDQLAVGGRLVAPVAVPGGQQCLMVVDRHVSGLQHSLLEPVHFVPLKSGVS
jgi:protein-L-isoaspartate(D-aspartate) O-methyltransferase